MQMSASILCTCRFKCQLILLTSNVYQKIVCVLHFHIHSSQNYKTKFYRAQNLLSNFSNYANIVPPLSHRIVLVRFETIDTLKVNYKISFSARLFRFNCPSLDSEGRSA